MKNEQEPFYKLTVSHHRFLVVKLVVLLIPDIKSVLDKPSTQGDNYEKNLPTWASSFKFCELRHLLLHNNTIQLLQFGSTQFETSFVNIYGFKFASIN